MLSFWFKHCERVTSTGAYIRELDGLRFLALLMVFLLHLNHAVLGHPGIEGSMAPNQESITRILEFGALGVQVFFCISGFILGLPFAQASLLSGKSVSLQRFYLRRLTRLEPPLIIHLTIMLVVYTVFVGKSFSELLPHYGATVTYLHTHLYGYESPLNPMTWSLEVEAQFYLCTPLLCLVFRIPGSVGRRLVILACMIVFALIENRLPRTILLVQLPYFLAGFLLAEIYLTDWQPRPKASAWADVLAVASIAAFVFACDFHKSIPLISAVMALIMFCFFIGVFRGVFFRWIFCNRILATIGGMCYTFYLYHLAVIATCSRFLRTCFEGWGYFETYFVYLLAIGAVNLVVCSALFVFFERPFMKWRPRAGNWLNGIVNRPEQETGS